MSFGLGLENIIKIVQLVLVQLVLGTWKRGIQKIFRYVFLVIGNYMELGLNLGFFVSFGWLQLLEGDIDSFQEGIFLKYCMRVIIRYRIIVLD